MSKVKLTVGVVHDWFLENYDEQTWKAFTNGVADDLDYDDVSDLIDNMRKDETCGALIGQAFVWLDSDIDCSVWSEIDEAWSDHCKENNYV